MKKLLAIWAVTLLLILTPLWWWALVGMSANVGAAWFLTDLLVVIGAVTLTGHIYINEL